MAFQVDLELDKYNHLWPEQPPSHEIINFNADIEDAVWNRQVPEKLNMNFFDLEKKRLRQGAFIVIKDTLLWIPPNYYHFLENGIAGTGRPEFRLKELKNSYYKLWVRANPHATGTFDIKNRQDGRTTRVVSDSLFEMQDGVNNHGQINIQSKTNADAERPCWSTVKSQWLNYPKWLKDLLYSDFSSGNNIETQLKFTREEREIRNLRGEQIIVPSRNLFMSYYPAVFNAQDGSSNVLKCVVDEFCKWITCSPAKFLTNSRQFMQVGATRKGLYEIFSSPADFNHKYVDDVFKIWENSDPDKLDEFGTTQSGLFRYHSNPLDGIEGYYDKYGDVDPTKIYDRIMYLRKKATKDEELGEIRANPLNQSEMFGSYDNNLYWDNIKGIIKRKLFVVNTIYKDEVTLEPKYQWGNLEMVPSRNGEQPEVYFRPNETNEFDMKTGRFCFSELPDGTFLNENTEPPAFIESVIGVDPYHLGKTGKLLSRRSQAGVVGWKFRSLGVENFVPRPTFFYNCRPPHIHTFFWDMIMAAIYTKSMVQYEKTSDEMERFFDENGYGEWILNSSTSRRSKQYKTRTEIGRGKKGGAFMVDVKSLVNILTNLPINPDHPYILDKFWFEQLLQQLIDFNEDDTSKFDLVMGLFQAVYGATKIVTVKGPQTSDMGKMMLNYFTS